jgi:molybdopterin molybdotransferase
MITYAQAQERIVAEARLMAVQSLAPAEALGCVLAQDVVANRALPPFDNTAMDGFALRAADSQNAPVKLPVVGSVAAGDVPDMGEQAGVVEIMTGAPVPRWCDCIVPVENVEVERGGDGAPLQVTLKVPIEPGKHIRRAGEDVQAGQTLLRKGRVITPQVMAVLTALGMAEIEVVARPAIALIGTGQEVIRNPKTPLQPGQIYDSNTPYLRAALAREGYDARTMPGSPDDTQGFLEALTMATDADVIISTGAVSMGRRDFVPDALAKLGARTVFHKCAIRPGKPILFARLKNGAWFFGLPGNPVSAAVGLAFFVLPLLDALAGLQKDFVRQGKLSRDYTKKKGMTMFAKAKLEDGEVNVLPGQQSFRIAPLLTANGWAVIDAKYETATAGTLVDFLPFERSFG